MPHLEPCCPYLDPQPPQSASRLRRRGLLGRDVGVPCLNRALAAQILAEQPGLNDRRLAAARALRLGRLTTHPKSQRDVSLVLLPQVLCLLPVPVARGEVLEKDLNLLVPLLPAGR